VTHVIEQGTVFARYRVDSMVGRGGMGVVYRATDLSLERPVALKLIAPEFAGDKRFRDRFLKEPRMAASLDHPNVVPIYEAGEHDGQLYLAMRYVEGRDLKTVLERDGKLRSEERLSENNRKAKFYVLTPLGRKQLEREEQRWERVIMTISSVLEGA